jgi:peptidoglycan/xylan/chitin deacetylase (PgdA/CDA1 family)
MDTPARIPLKLRLPDGVRCAIALSYDLEMCAGYAPDGINHGRIMRSVQLYTLDLCRTAAEFGVSLHFFYVCNGLDGADPAYLHEITRSGHVIDSHTYSHQGVAVATPQLLDEELKKANRLLLEKLGITSTILRGPYGYKEGWKNLPAENRQVVLQNGFRYLSGEYSDVVYGQDWSFWVNSPERDLPYLYPEGLMEIPLQGWTDRMWFDMRPEVDQSVVNSWRAKYGHRPLPAGWEKAPWTPAGALDEWIALHLAILDHCYEEGLLYVPTWHPYTHYIHDPHNKTLRALLQRAAEKKEKVWVCTLRDAVAMLQP